MAVKARQALAFPYPPRALPRLPAGCRGLVLGPVSSLYSLHLSFDRSPVTIAPRHPKRSSVALLHCRLKGEPTFASASKPNNPPRLGVSGAEGMCGTGIGTFGSKVPGVFHILILLASGKDQKMVSGSSGQGVCAVANSFPRSLVLGVLVPPTQASAPHSFSRHDRPPCKRRRLRGRMISCMRWGCLMYRIGAQGSGIQGYPQFWG